MATARYIYTLSLSDENKWSVTGLIVDGNTNIASTSGDPNILGDVPNDYISLSGTVSGGMLYDGTLLNDSSALVSTGATSKILLTDVWYPAGSFVTVLPVDPVTGANQYDLVNDTAINVTLCYLRGTLILTDRGEVAIEDLSEGDLLVTRFGGLRPIRWIGRQSLHGQRAMGQEAILFMPGSLGAGMPRRPLRVSPGHSMLVGETLVLASDLVNGVTVTREAPRDAWEYVQVEFDSHDLILAEGAWSESFADVGTFRARFDNAAEFHARFPDHVAPQEPQLCAPRPESGPVLETALRATAALAAAKVAPGTLAGRVESCATPCRVTGWATDTAHPDLPVLLEVVLDGEVIGTTLACHRRDDLDSSGAGRSRSGFAFIGDRLLSTAELRRVVVRRAADGRVLGAEAEPGPLDGHLDRVASPCRLEGWARDKTRPAEPVLLEAVLGDRVLGTVLASRRREDLARAGLGDVAFVFEAGLSLSPQDMDAIQLRRASDGAVLRRTAATREQPDQAAVPAMPG